MRPRPCPPHRLRRLAPWLAVLVGASVLTGCNNAQSTAGDQPTESSSSTSSSSASPSESPSSSSSPSRYAHGQPTDLPHSRLAAAAFHVAALESSVAKTAEEKAVVNSWMRFWQAQADTYYYGQPVKDLDEVSTGAARKSVVDFLAFQKRHAQRSVGWARDNVTGLTVKGAKATVRDCTRNFTFLTDLEGEPATVPPKFYLSTGTLTKKDGTWVVTSAASKPSNRSCL